MSTRELRSCASRKKSSSGKPPIVLSRYRMHPFIAGRADRVVLVDGVTSLMMVVMIVMIVMIVMVVMVVVVVRKREN